MIWRTWASDSRSSARSEYSTRAVGLVLADPTTPRYWVVSASSRSSRRPRASFVAVPSEGIRSPRISREIVEWSTPDCWASWRCDIFLALSCVLSHSLKARPFCVVIGAWALRGNDPGWVNPLASLSMRRLVTCITRSYRLDDHLAVPSGTNRRGRVGRGGTRWPAALGLNTARFGVWI